MKWFTSGFFLQSNCKQASTSFFYLHETFLGRVEGFHLQTATILRVLDPVRKSKVKARILITGSASRRWLASQPTHPAYRMGLDGVVRKLVTGKPGFPGDFPLNPFPKSLRHGFTMSYVSIGV